jgi:hypothetical protein
MIRRFLSAVILIFPVATAMHGAESRLTNASKAVEWSGLVEKGRGITGEVPECRPGCQRFDFTIALPRGIWRKRDGGVEIAIQWVGLTSAIPPEARFAREGRPASDFRPVSDPNNLGDNLKLYVYRGASLIAKSDGSTSLAQSVQLRDAENGPVRVYVAFDPESASPAIAYHGLAQLEYDPAPQPVRQLLPDLEARPQQHLTFEPGAIFKRAISPDFPSCYYTEVEEDGAHTCLRFDQVFANVGEGDLEVRFTVPNSSTATNIDAMQRIDWSDRKNHFEDRPIGKVEFHPTHEHYHLMNLGLTRLWSVDEAGTRAGAAPVRQTNIKSAMKGTMLRSGRKVSFCMVDTNIDAWGQKGTGPRTWKSPDCQLPVSTDAAGRHFAQGVTKGWRDVYEWYIPHQYIEVTGVPDGLYILETIANPDSQVIEEKKSNNCVSIYIQLSGMSSGPHSARIVGPGPACTSEER